MNNPKNEKPNIRLLADDQGWIEGEALRQLENTARFAGIDEAVGLPDLHPGKGTPVGAAFLSNEIIYPTIVGSDVGCGIGLWQTALKRAKAKRDKWAKRLQGLQQPWDGDVHGWLEQYGLNASNHATALGTIGGGNHFAELQIIDTVICPERFKSLGMRKDVLCLLVHSGSRGLGERLYRHHSTRFGADGLHDSSDEAHKYLAAHDHAIRWAAANRALIARRFANMLNTRCRAVADVCHNQVQKKRVDGKTRWLHRKGAAAADKGLIAIPGSRGSLTYLVEPVGDQRLNLWSVAHGAGRKWTRKSCRGRLGPTTSAAALSHTRLGSVVICSNKELLFEEAPQAYKKIETVINDMVKCGIIRVIATLRPLITYKTRSRS